MILFLMVLIGLTDEISQNDFIARRDLTGYQKVLLNNLEKDSRDYKALTLLSLSKSCSIFPWDPFCFRDDDAALKLANESVKINPKYYLAYVARYAVNGSENDFRSAKSLNPSWPYFLRMEALRALEKRDWKKGNELIDQYLEKEKSPYKYERAASALCAISDSKKKDRAEVEKIINRGLNLLNEENWWDFYAYFYCLYQKSNSATLLSREELQRFKRAEELDLKTTEFYRLKMYDELKRKNFKACSDLGREGVRKNPSLYTTLLPCLIAEKKYKEAEESLRAGEALLARDPVFQIDMLENRVILLSAQGDGKSALDVIGNQKKILKNGKEEDLLITVYLAQPTLMKDGFAGIRKIYQRRAAEEEKYSIEYYNILAAMLQTGLNWSVDPIDLMKIIDSNIKVDRAHQYLKSEAFLSKYETIFMKVNRSEAELLKIYDRWLKFDPQNKLIQGMRISRLLAKDIAYKKEAEKFIKDLPLDSFDRLYIEVLIARANKDERAELDLMHRIALKDFFPNSIENYVNRVADYRGDKKAVRVFENFIEDNKLDIDNDKLLAIHAYRLNKVGEREKAIELLKKAEAINPYNALVLANIALFYAQGGKCKRAIPYAQKAAKLVAIFDEIGASLENFRLVCGVPELKYGHLYVFN